MDQKNNPDAGTNAANRHADAQSDQSVDEFFNRLQSDMRRPDLSQDAISAAFQAIQKLALDPEADEPVDVTARSIGTPGGHTCPACNAQNGGQASFCASCGTPLQQRSGAGAAHEAQHGQHHYHHHYHYYPPAANGISSGAMADFRPSATVSGTARDPKARAAAGGAPLSRAEVGARKVTQDWTQACNTKHLDDLVELYASDALVMRPNFPTVRGTAAIREFFFAALDAGLGEAELEPIRMELFGDVAYEAGRCKTLVPGAMGKRREERGKYMILLTRQPASDWKIIADCWSSDLSLGVTTEAARPSVATPSAPLQRPVRK